MSKNYLKTIVPNSSSLNADLAVLADFDSHGLLDAFLKEISSINFAELHNLASAEKYEVIRLLYNLSDDKVFETSVKNLSSESREVISSIRDGLLKDYPELPSLVGKLAYLLREARNLRTSTDGAEGNEELDVEKAFSVPRRIFNFNGLQSTDGGKFSISHRYLMFGQGDTILLDMTMTTNEVVMMFGSLIDSVVSGMHEFEELIKENKVDLSDLHTEVVYLENLLTKLSELKDIASKIED